MKAVQTHIIKSQRYELVLEDASKAYTYQSKVSRLQNYSVNRILQKVMDNYNSPEHLDQFDEVILDLGTLSMANFERDLEQRIEEALTSFFKNNSYENGTLKIGKRKQLYDEYIKQIAFFLENGYINWSTPLSIKPIDMFQIVLQENKKEFVVLLKNLGRKESIRKRLITQLEDDFLEQIVVATVGKEAVYINQNRRDIVKCQEEYKLIEVDSKSYRNAIWEITLAYIFLDVTSYSGQKNFLQYLTRKIAQKYRLTYSSLLDAIVSGIKIRLNKEGVIVDFEKLLITLQEEEEELSKNIPVDESNKDTTKRFLEHLHYYLKYNSLPANSTLFSYDMLFKSIETNSIKNSKAFYYFFDQHMKSRSTIEQWIIKVPDSILNTVITQSPNKIFIRFSIFLKQITEIANQLHIKSLTLEVAQKLFGKISLKAYVVIVNSSIDETISFLYELMKQVQIDKEFFILLEKIESKKRTDRDVAIKSFVNEVGIHRGKENLKTTALQVTSISLELSKNIFLNYNKRSTITLTDFQEQLQCINCEKETLQLVQLLLEVTILTNRYTIQEIAGWVQQRRKELVDKGEQGDKIIIQLLEIIKLLNINKVVYDGVQEALKTTKIDNNIVNEISISKINHLIDAIYIQFNKPNSQNLNQRIEELIAACIKKHGIPKTVLLSRLQEQASGRTHNEILKRILNDQLARKSPSSKTIDAIYKSDVVHYFCSYGKLPWWIKNKSFKVLQDYFGEIIELFPDRFKVWFANAKNQKVIIQLIDDASYEKFIKHINPSVNTSILSVKELIDQVIEEEISGIRSVALNYKNDIRYLLLNYIYRKPVLDALALTRYLIENMAATFRIPVLDIKILVHEKRNDKKEKLWMEKETEPESLRKTSKLVTEINQLIDQEKDWNEVLNITLKKEVLSILKIINTEAPDELMFNLKRPFFRRILIKKLDNKSHIEFIYCFLTQSERSRFSDMIALLETLCKQYSRSDYQIVWNKFINYILLKVAIDKPVNWLVKDWSIILYKSVSSLPETISSIAFPSQNMTVSKDVLDVIDDIKRHLENNNEDAIEEEDEIEEDIRESIYITNSGLVILGPYTPMLFDRLGLLKDGVFKDEESIQKGIYVLQYAVTGKEEVEEQDLILNKIICGIPIHKNIEQQIALTADEKKIVESLLHAVIGNWSALGNTSIEGLRETFLLRDGRISIEDDSYILRVEEKTFDMLLDQIPWSIGKLKFSWMQKLLDVVWRN